ncbi:MAG: YbaN family protein [Oscillospiraceae bacterium]|nr:YbaN family protein [Oscillospiraceae bacterium]
MYITLGGLSLALGAAGIFLPLLPTTPFVLLAAFFFGASSERAYERLINMPFFGNIITSYRNKTGFSAHTKITTLALLWSGLLISALFMNKLWAYVTLGLIGLCVSLHIVLLGAKK